jgi:acyl-CoA synthetase (AMP-forming)/AMP-acid ligase II
VANSATFGWQGRVSDRDVYLHTLPMFHCNGWGMPYAQVAMGALQIVLRKVDGAEILRANRAPWRDAALRSPAVVAAILDAAANVGRAEYRAAGTVRMSSPAPAADDGPIERMETELGWEFIQIYGLTETAPLCTMNRTRAEWDHLSPAERAQKLGRAGAPAFGMRADVARWRGVASRQSRLEGYWQQTEATRGGDSRRVGSTRGRRCVRRRGLILSDQRIARRHHHHRW